MHMALPQIANGLPVQQQAAPDMNQRSNSPYRGGSEAAPSPYAISSQISYGGSLDGRAAAKSQALFASLQSTPDPFAARGSSLDYDRARAPAAQGLYSSFTVHHSSQESASASVQFRRGPQARSPKSELGPSLKTPTNSLRSLTRLTASSFLSEDLSIKWDSKSDADKVLALIDLQDFEGYWPENNLEIPLIIGFDIPKCPEKISNKVWITLLIIAFLDVKMVNEEGTWAMVGEKARGFLSGVMSEEMANLRTQAVEYVRQN